MSENTMPAPVFDLPKVRDTMPAPTLEQIGKRQPQNVYRDQPPGTPMRAPTPAPHDPRSIVRS